MTELIATRGIINNGVIKSLDLDINSYDGCDVIITVLNAPKKTQSRAEKRKELLRTRKYVNPSVRTRGEIDSFIAEMRDDRILESVF